MIHSTRGFLFQHFAVAEIKLWNILGKNTLYEQAGSETIAMLKKILLPNYTALAEQNALNNFLTQIHGSNYSVIQRYQFTGVNTSWLIQIYIDSI